MSSPVWFITETSHGFGLLLSLQALHAGHKVIGTVRNKQRSADAVRSIEQAGGSVVELDMTEPRDSIIEKVQAAEKIHSRIDFLINNAGYSTLGPVEFFTEDDATNQFRTNVFGPLFTIQAVLPGMRARRHGTIVNISSVAAQDALASCGLYAGSKFGLEGLSEALATEVGSFGISVLIVEPGAFRTNFWHASILRDVPADIGYEGTPVDTVLNKFRDSAGKQAGDPEKAVDIIFQVVSGQGAAGHLKGQVMRLPLGKDAVSRIEKKLQLVKTDVELCHKLAISTDFSN
ncbi:short chain oxidoreductase/dehydrogenase [Trichoderma guizhouense]|uniref:Short chain oxidoreductase/dehydrogenase n=1 Tax=Trichoderma guizhouense TaxID=1491466 RepID=A0A1T3CYZ4_9HYPO|nr:short chain oxidoreductase/dehydrogenase [Trichoderma guizhouense]